MDFPSSGEGSFGQPMPIEGATVSSGSPSGGGLMSSLLPGIGGLVGGLFGGIGSIFTNMQQQKMAREQMAFQERMANTQHQREVADLRAAGLNPMLSAKLGGNAAPPGAMAQMQNPGQSIGEGIASSAKMMAIDLPQLESQLRMQTASTDQNYANAERARAAAALDLASIPNVEMDTAQKEAVKNRITTLIQPEKEQTQAQAALQRAQATLIPSTAKQIQADTERARAQAELQRAQKGKAEFESSNLGLTIKSLGDVTGAIGDVLPMGKGLRMLNNNGPPKYGGRNSAGAMNRGVIPYRSRNPEEMP